QRLREGVTRLPPMAALGRVFQRDENEAVDSAREVGYLMAAELRLLDVDVSFAPVLDVDYGRNSVIGDRAFACDAQQISALAAAFIAGMREAGMAAAGKHFPGHGWADADTHHKDALDNRSFDEIWQQDLVPFRALIAGGMEGIMPAHVLYSGCSDMPAGFSDFWLRQVLREKLGFDGVIFSDDLSMKAAHTAGGYRQRAEAALVAGCNVLLPCNNREGALEVLAYLEEQDCAPVVSLKQMRGRQFSADVDRMRHGAELCQSLWSEVERG
ncbi:MAG: beta-N-acetylhexosaminidase, partial [Oceanospirillaceae bacterium]|nr:beta-N-acetylhexosaminidase [Oceanospirillaceae bacterium]